ncbi:1043_t:CDS:1, partial [Gigaspora rosea]
APNLPITSLILPPRKKTTLQIPLGKEIFNVCFNDDGDVSFNDGGENSLGSRTIRKARKGRSRDDML